MNDGTISTTLLDAIGEAFNRNDIDAVMAHFADDAVFDHGAGPDVHGKRFSGKDEIRAAFEGLFNSVESVHWKTLDARVSGDKAYCEFRRTATLKSGDKQDFLALDVLTFRDNKIIHKDTFFKNRSA